MIIIRRKNIFCCVVDNPKWDFEIQNSKKAGSRMQPCFFSFQFSPFSLYNQHRVSVSKETVFLGNGFLVGPHHKLVSAESGHHHQHGAL